MHREEVSVGVVVAKVLVDVVITDIDREGAGGRRGTVQQVIDRHPDATARASLGFGVGAEGEEREKSGAGGAPREEGSFHDTIV